MHSATIATAPLIARRYGMSAFDLGGGLVLIVAARLDDSEKLRKRRGMVKLPTRGLPHSYVTRRTHSAVHSLLCRVSKDKVQRWVPKRALQLRAIGR